MSGSRNTKKSETAKATESSPGSTDMAKLMDAITNSEKTVLAKIASLDTKIESKCQMLNENMESLRRDYKDQLEGLRSEFSAKLSPLEASVADNRAQIASLENATNNYSDRVVNMEEEMCRLKATVTTLTEKTEDLEGRQRRCNIRILGVKEQFEVGTRPVDSVAKLLQDVLGMDSAPTLDRAHRGLQSTPAKGKQPRPLIVKFHYYQEKLDVLRRAARKESLEYDGNKILIFPDLPATVAKRRGAFKEVKELLRGCQGVKYGMLYPARLRISSSLGEKIFLDPAAAKDYTQKHLETHLRAADAHKLSHSSFSQTYHSAFD
uniref:Transposase element L1Md-A101/L1Md-A102/L1Md-A2 n=1 Tax=Oryzias sinensis TaxID=183150 RepID=A0A8C7WTR4_9TELE